MPEELGKCPTCKRELSINAASCPNCGENEFFKKVPNQKDPIVKCRCCCGNGAYNHSYRQGLEENYVSRIIRCDSCKGSGAKKRLMLLDLRNNKLIDKIIEGEPVPRPSSWGPGLEPRILYDESNQGCFSQLVVLLGLLLVLGIELITQ